VYRAAWALTSRSEVRFILWVVFLSLFAWDIKLSFLPLYLQSVGLPTSEIGLIFSCMSGGSMVIRPLLGTLTGRFGRRPILLSAVGLGAIGIGLVPFLRAFWPLALAATAAGVASGITQPLTMSLIAGNVRPGEQGLAMSLRMSTNRLADLLSPIVFGALVAWTGLGGAFGVAAATLLAGVAVVGRGGGRAVFGRRE
jgi:MFS family permease